jgi:hypothetical protein
MTIPLVETLAAPDSAAEATCTPLRYSRCVVPSNVPTTW